MSIIYSTVFDSNKKPLFIKAIAAMSLNRVIGNQNRLPWSLPEDLAWFKQMTLGHTIVMGRKTFDSIQRKTLPHRKTIVVSRSLPATPGVQVIDSIQKLTSIFSPCLSQQKSRCSPTTSNHLEQNNSSSPENILWIVGGSEIYRQALPYCSDLYLTLIKENFQGDTFFPVFEDLFKLEAVIRDENYFSIFHYKNKRPLSL